VIKAFDTEAERIAPIYARSLSETLIPLALNSTIASCENVLQQKTLADARPLTAKSFQAALELSTKSAGIDSTNMSTNVHLQTESIDETRTKVLQLSAAFRMVERQGSHFSDMLTSTATGIGALFTSSNSSEANNALATLLKDIGSQAIAGIQGLLLAAEAQAAVKGVLTFGAALLEDAPLLAAAYLALEGAKGYINSLDTGGVVIGDQLIQAHDRETVIPFDKAPSFFAEAVNRGAAVNTVRDIYRPERTATTTSYIRIGFSELRNALTRNDTVSSIRSL